MLVIFLDLWFEFLTTEKEFSASWLWCIANLLTNPFEQRDFREGTRERISGEYTPRVVRER